MWIEKSSEKELIVFATNYDFLIPLSLLPNVIDLSYFYYENSVRSNNLSFKYQRFTPSRCKYIGIRKFCACGKDSCPFDL